MTSSLISLLLLLLIVSDTFTVSLQIVISSINKKHHPYNTLLSTPSASTAASSSSSSSSSRLYASKLSDRDTSFAISNLFPQKEIDTVKEPAAVDFLKKVQYSKVSVPSSIANGPVLTSYAKYTSSGSSSSSSGSSNDGKNGRVAAIDAFASFDSFLNTMKSSVVKKTVLPSIVLIHGFDSSCIEYRRLAKLLAVDRDVYVPDILGWGFSDHSNVVDFSPDAKLTHIKSFIRGIVLKKKGEKVVLVGASLGGAVALIVSVEEPELVDKLILIDAQGYIDGNGPKDDLPDALAQIGVGVLQSWPLRMFANIISYYDKSFATFDAVNCGRLHCFSSEWTRASINYLKSGGFIISNKVKQISKETLIIWGRNDKILDPSTALRFQTDISNNQLVYIEECGHVPHVEKPADVASLILQFLGDA